MPTSDADRATLLREMAQDESTLAITLAEQAVKSPSAWYDAVINKGMVFESRPPLLFDRDYFSYRCLRGTARQVGMGIPRFDGRASAAFTTTRQQQVGVVIEQPLIAAPAEYHKDINRLMAMPEFWAGNDPKNTGLLLRSLGYSAEMSRLAASSDTGAWAGKSYWQRFHAEAGSVSPMVNGSLVGTVDVAHTDPVPVPIRGSASSGAWLADEDGVSTLNDSDFGMGVVELDAFCFASLSDYSDKLGRNSWVEAIDLQRTIAESNAALYAYEVEAQFTSGTGVAGQKPAGIMPSSPPAVGNAFKIQNILKATDPSMRDLWACISRYKESNPQAAISLMSNRSLWGDDTREAEGGLAELAFGKVETGADYAGSRLIRYEGRDDTGGSAAFWIGQYPLYFNRSMIHALDAFKPESFMLGDFKRGLAYRRGSVMSAMATEAMIAGQSKLTNRIANWTWTDFKRTDALTPQGTGYLQFIQPNKS